MLMRRRDIVRGLLLLRFQPFDVRFGLSDDLFERLDHPRIVGECDNPANLRRPGANVRDQLIMHVEGN